MNYKSPEWIDGYQTAKAEHPLWCPLLNAAPRPGNGPTCHKCGKLVETGDVLCSEHEQEVIEALIAQRLAAPREGQAFDARAHAEDWLNDHKRVWSAYDLVTLTRLLNEATDRAAGLAASTGEGGAQK